ncbi:MAG TPA: prolyl oligopeptidase family serine peptidase [Tepidisphaeraceae bacterium]|nr:prolyl oligopeptidase family serine peptidase [Tepidisphaeraceae bacterium]
MSFLWYWPDNGAGSWNFDKWKAIQTWKPVHSEQSGTHELVAPIEQGATPQQWEEKRKMWQGITDQLLGTLTDRAPTQVRFEMLGETLESRGESPYTMRRLRYTLTDKEWGYAWLLVPKNLKGRGAAMLALHQTSCDGKSEAVGFDVLPDQINGVWYARELAEQGFVVFAPDAIAFGERQSGHANAYYHSADEFFGAQPQGSVMGKMAYDTSRALDVMQQLPEVDASRMGCLGHSHGGYGTLFAMLADQRIKAGVISCGMDLFRDDAHPDRWWRMTSLIPRLGLYDGKMENTPIDFQIWVAMIAPRPLLVSIATRDRIFPNTAHLPGAIDTLSRRAYRIMGDADALKVHHFASDHCFPPDVRTMAYQMLRERLS